MGRLLHLARIGIRVPEHVACELDNGALHAEADAQERNVVDTSKMHRLDFALDTAVAEPGSDQNAGHRTELVGDVLGGQFLGIDITQFHLAIVDRSGVDERFTDGFVSVGQLGVFTDQRDFDFWPTGV